MTSFTDFRENYKWFLGSDTMVTKRDMKSPGVGSIKNRLRRVRNQLYDGNERVSCDEFGKYNQIRDI